MSTCHLNWSDPRKIGLWWKLEFHSSNLPILCTVLEQNACSTVLLRISPCCNKNVYFPLVCLFERWIAYSHTKPMSSMCVLCEVHAGSERVENVISHMDGLWLTITSFVCRSHSKIKWYSIKMHIGQLTY